MFQFKINHSILQNDKCLACGSKQTLVHLMVECQCVNTLWNTFASWWNSCIMVTDKICAHYPEKPFFRTLNSCLIVARFYIYIAPKENEPLSFLAFKILLKNKLSTEPSYVQESVCLK